MVKEIPSVHGVTSDCCERHRQSRINSDCKLPTIPKEKGHAWKKGTLHIQGDDLEIKSKGDCDDNLPLWLCFTNIKATIREIRMFLNALEFINQLGKNWHLYYVYVSVYMNIFYLIDKMAFIDDFECKISCFSIVDFICFLNILLATNIYFHWICQTFKSCH